MNRGGFTFVETMVVFLVLGVLANVAVPAVGGVKKRAEAARILADFNVIRQAALQHYTETGAYPATQPPGVVPGELTERLPQGFDFDRHGVLYQWYHAPLAGGLPGQPGLTDLLAVQVVGSDVEVMDLVRRRYGGVVSGTGVSAWLFID